MRPRRFVHRGSIEVAAYLVARDRVLDLWTAGASLHAAGDRFLLRLDPPRRALAESCRALPLVRRGSLLLSAPLEDDELAALAPAPGSIVLVEGGEANAIEVGPAIDLAAWIEHDEWTTIAASSLGAELPAAPLALPSAAPISRAKFAGVGPAAPAQQAMLRDLQERAIAEGSSSIRFFARALQRLRDALAPKAPATAGSTRSLVAQARGPSGPSALDLLLARLQTFIARLLVATRLAQWVGKRQAAYLERLFDMFERGALDEALRHAIPLDGLGSGDAPPALTTPTARKELEIKHQRVMASSSIGLDESLTEMLRRHYRAAFDRLAGEGRIEEAAFVLVELLHREVEAIAFLERNNRLRLAAEIADGRDLPADLRVRQWFLAGDRERAIAIARAHGAFAAAIARLEASNQREEAAALRVSWAGVLADAGDFAQAVEVIWRVPAARALATEWIELGIEMGGVAGARLLARKTTLATVRSAELFARIEGLLGETDGVELRRAFAEGLIKEPSQPESRIAARATARALFADPLGEGDKKLLDALIAHSADAGLRADRPPFVTARRAERPLRREIDRFDAGTLVIHDAALLPDGRTLLALGELGVRIVTRDGRTVAHFDEPAHALVVSDHGDRAIAIANRGSSQRLARIDLKRRISRVWCETALGTYARDFDGAEWIVAERLRLLVIDALAENYAALREIPLAGEDVQPVLIARSAHRCGVMVCEPFAIPERCAFELPSFQLRNRGGFTIEDPLYLIPAVAIADDGEGALFVWKREDDHQTYVLAPRGMLGGVPIGLPTEAPSAACIGTDSIAATLIGPEGMRIVALDRRAMTLDVDIYFQGATAGSVRAMGSVIIACDDRGRVVAIDTRTGARVRDLRL